jgi:hypothetical protein
METERSRFTFVEEAVIPRHSSRDHDPDPDQQGGVSFLAAVEHLGRRSEGPEAWTAGPGNDPIAFLIDAIADAVTLWAGGSLVYRNRAAERLEAERCELERRSLRFQTGDTEYLLEVARKARHSTSGR